MPEYYFPWHRFERDRVFFSTTWAYRVVAGLALALGTVFGLSVVKLVDDQDFLEETVFFGIGSVLLVGLSLIMFGVRREAVLHRDGRLDIRFQSWFSTQHLTLKLTEVLVMPKTPLVLSPTWSHGVHYEVRAVGAGFVVTLFSHRHREGIRTHLERLQDFLPDLKVTEEGLDGILA